MAIDLLSLTSEVTKKRGDLFLRGQELAAKSKSLENLERKNLRVAETLVESLKGEEIRWEEYERALVNESLTAALAAVYLGSPRERAQENMISSWPIIIGDMLPPLVVFLNQTQDALSKGFNEFQEPYDAEEWEFATVRLDPWKKLLNRVIRYISTPVHSFYSLGQFLTNRSRGYKEMRRVARGDDRVCPDCVRFDQMGWQPLGSLPMPGRECRCYDRCRCSIEYR